MRNMQLSLEMAELAVDFRERGVVGFDLAGEEGGFPPKKHIDAFHYIQRESSTSRSTPARRSARRASGRPSSGAAPTASATRPG